MSTLIPKHGGYRNLRSFQIAQLVYDLTVRFCDAFIDRHSRTHDQMVQAARSGVQNIAEGSEASATSKKTELKLTQVARASLEELRLDYEDFLRQRGLGRWEKFSPLQQELIARRCTTADEVARWVKEVAGRENGQNGRDGLNGRDGRDGQSVGSESIPSIPSIPSIKSIKSIRSVHSSIAANAALTLITVANSLLDRQVGRLATDFETHGGFTEKLYKVRTLTRQQS